MKTTRFGIEIEFTGITRRKAADVAAAFFGGTVTHGVGYDRYTTKDASGRTWSFMRDGSIVPMRREHGRKVGACDDYKVELVTPILTYEQDMDTLQELILDRFPRERLEVSSLWMTSAAFSQIGRTEADGHSSPAQIRFRS